MLELILNEAKEVLESAAQVLEKVFFVLGQVLFAFGHDKCHDKVLWHFEYES